MRLSSRRIWCALLFLLLLIGGMLIDPVGRAAKQFAVKSAFGSHVSIEDVTFHRKQELLEIENLTSEYVANASLVSVSAQHALVKLDTPNLVGKRFLGTKAKLQGVRVELASLTASPPKAKPKSSFDKTLDALLATLDWDTWKSDCDALLTAEDVLQELDAKMRGWLMRSQQIMFHADQLTQSVQSYSNPLRHVSTIRSQLNQIEQLRVEQTSLQQQFKTMNGTLLQQVSVIQAASDRDVVALRTKTNRGSESLRADLAEQLVLEWTRQLLDHQSRFTHSMMVVFDSRGANPLNLNVRDTSRNPSLFDLSNIEVDGEFICDHESVSFGALGEYKWMQQSDYSVVPQTKWTVQLREANVGLQIEIASSADSESWQMLGTAFEPRQSDMSPSNRSSVTEVADMLYQTALGDTKIFEVNATITGSTMHGTAKLDVSQIDVLKKLPCAGNADLVTWNNSKSEDLLNSAIEAGSQWIAFELAGTATEPQLVLKSELPKVFVDALTESIQRRIEQQRSESEAKLVAAVTDKIDAIKLDIQGLMEKGQQTVSQQQAALADMQSQLELNLQSRDGYEYARRPATPAANR